MHTFAALALRAQSYRRIAIAYQTEGIFANRAFNRRSHHFDHRGHSYSSTWGVGFAAAITNLGGALPCTASAATACILDPIITVTGVKSGYKLKATGAGGAGTAASPYTSFEASAVPVTVGTTGQRTFCSDESGVVRFNPAGGADPGTDVLCEALTALQ
jgi:hypothetical protein